MLLLTISALLLANAAAYDPTADPAAIVQLGSLRVTVLTSQLLRFELASAANESVFDDRATLAVVNRRLPVPRFSVTQLNTSTVQLKTDDVTVVYTDAGPAAGVCAAGHESTDGVAPKRTQKYSKGANVTTAAECCDLCTGDPSCLFYIFDEVDKLNNCYPLTSTGGERQRSGRFLGSVAAALPPDASLTVTYAQGTWSPASVDPHNLNGTYLSLDCGSTPMACIEHYRDVMQPGLVSTSGYAILDDTATARFVPAPGEPGGVPTWWTAVNRSVGSADDALDLYFMTFGGNLDFRRAMLEWMSVLGRPPLPPRASFGVWWSRYWPYTQSSIVSEVLAGYANYSIPLSNLVFDTDWHKQPPAPCSSWGNMDVNTADFPSLSTFEQALHADGAGVIGHPLMLSFNLHPDAGIDHCDSRYAEFATAIGVNASSNVSIACDLGNATYWNALATLYLDADPLSGVDAWWTDFISGCGSPNPLLWSNRLFYDHGKYSRGKRGQAFSRFGGIGNHRYPIGFSGDTFQHEAVLGWQVKTTQTAANVLFGYWSHDIGGFHDGTGCVGDADPKNSTGAEMLLRWIQFGAASPLLRTHCNHCERRIWMFPYFTHMRDAMVLHSALGPYLYTEARRFYDTGIAIVHPLYYDAPGDPSLYSPLVVDMQYMLGDAVLAAPITLMMGGPADNGTAALVLHTYLPSRSGVWSNWNGTAVFNTSAGPVNASAAYGLGDIPLFVRSGGLLPLSTMSDVFGDFPGTLVWAVWPGAPSPGANYTLYEDEGDSDAYEGGAYVLTNASTSGDVRTSSRVTLTIAAVLVSGGALPQGFPTHRTHVLQLRGVGSRGVESVSVDGAAIPASKGGCNGAGSGAGASPNFNLSTGGSGAGGWCIVSAAEHSLSSPEGAMLVYPPDPLSSFTTHVVEVVFG